MTLRIWLIDAGENTFLTDFESSGIGLPKVELLTSRLCRRTSGGKAETACISGASEDSFETWRRRKECWWR